jgi:hypothetical protein
VTGVPRGYLDGEFLPKDRACVSVDDRGFPFTDGINGLLEMNRLPTEEVTTVCVQVTRGRRPPGGKIGAPLTADLRNSCVADRNDTSPCCRRAEALRFYD